MQRGSNLLFLMDYRPAAGAHIWSPGPSSSCRREECFLFIFLLFCGLRFFPLLVCVFFFPLVKSPLLASQTLRVFLNWIFLLNRTKNRLDVSTQFFRDGKSKHRCVRYSTLFAWAVVFCSFPSFKHLHEKRKKTKNKQKKIPKTKQWHWEKWRKRNWNVIFCQILLIYIDSLLWSFQINIHFEILSNLFVYFIIII